MDPNNEYDYGYGFSIQTWEEACFKSQNWAIQERRKRAVRRDRRRAYVVIAILVIITIVALLIVQGSTI